MSFFKKAQRFTASLTIAFQLAVASGSAIELPDVEAITIAKKTVVSPHTPSIRSKGYDKNQNDHNYDLVPHNGQHEFRALKISTSNLGNWGAYAITPNNLNRKSLGLAYLIDPYKIKLYKKLSLEFTAGAGVITGYTRPITPLIIAESSFIFHENSKWKGQVNIGTTPHSGKQSKTSPYISLTYKI